MSGKGTVLEEIVQRFLLRQGYRELDEKDPKVNVSTSEVMGRGTDHEMDAMGEYRHSIPFVYPIRLLGEAKCYKSSKTVGVDIVREAVAVRKDVSENYEGLSTFEETDRRTECVSIFSTSGFSESARELAFAHGVYLVPMGHLLNIVDTITESFPVSTDAQAAEAVDRFFEEHRRRQVYFGTLDGGYPLSLNATPLPEDAFEGTDSVTVRATILDDYETTGADRFEIETQEYDWSGTTEVPDALSKKLQQNEFEILLPVRLNGIQRFLNLRGKARETQQT